jgi:hypothetical protein
MDAQLMSTADGLKSQQTWEGTQSYYFKYKSPRNYFRKYYCGLLTYGTVQSGNLKVEAAYSVETMTKVTINISVLSCAMSKECEPCTCISSGSAAAELNPCLQLAS